MRAAEVHRHGIRGDQGRELIAAKLRVPTPLSPLLPRPRLQDRIRTLVQQSIVVLLVGPSGIGKTAELSQWTTAETRPVAWINVDGRDNDPQRFWQHVTGALGEPTLPAFLPGSDVHVAALAERILRRGHRPVLVLDEYEHVIDQEIHDQLDLLVRACGDGLTTVIASRVRPPLRLERLQLSGRLATLTWWDLRFDPQEAQSLLAEAFGVVADTPAAVALVAATDGWAGGLMLAGAHLRSGGELAGELVETSQEMTDFLLDHVWTGLAPEIRDFLLDTAVLGRFSAALADAARGRGDSAEILDRLRMDGLFLVTDDGVGTWVRYQRLFRSALIRRQESVAPERVRTLHREAAGWHAAHGGREEAIDHALLAQDYELAIGLLGNLFEDYFQAGRLVTLEQWLSTLPDESIRGNPGLAKRGLNLWCSLGRFDERDRWSRAGGQDGDNGRPLRSEDAWKLCVLREQGDFPLALRQGRALLTTYDPGAPLPPSQARISVARTLLLAGQLTECSRLLEEIAPLWSGAAVPPPLRASLHGIAGLAAHLAGDAAGTAAHADQFKVALAECQIRPKPRMTPEGIIVQAVVTDDPAALQELLDSPPGFGTDKTMAAFAQLVLARELLRHHDARGTADRLAAADRLLAECPNPMGLTDLRDQVASSLQEPVPAAPPTPVDLLSERERLVVQYLRSELTLREIADDLFLSVNTVKTHARHIYRKLRVSGRQEAAAVRLPAVQVGHETGEAS